MKSLLLATAVLALSVGTAAAQDQVYDWSGAYVGAQVGYGWGEGKYISPIDGQSASPHPNGVFGGVYGGYNYQFENSFVVGIEGDININDGDDTAIFGPKPQADTVFELKWSGAARARLGYAFGRALPFIAGGAAFGRINHDVADITIIPRSPIDEFNDTQFGWTVGAGVDYALSNNVIGRIEYRYTDYGSNDYPATALAYSHIMRLKTNDLRIGIAYKF